VKCQYIFKALLFILITTQTTKNKQQKTNNEKQTTKNKQRTTNNKRRTTNNEQITTFALHHHRNHNGNHHHPPTHLCAIPAGGHDPAAHPGNGS